MDGKHKTKGGKITGVENGWFSETETMWPGQKFSLALEDFSAEKSVLYRHKSKFQEIMVFQSAQYGKALVIDGILQLTEHDEFAYSEMMAHLPLFCHPNPKSVLICGGGDGAILREVCRHKSVEHITLVEIDPVVIEVSRTHLNVAPPGLFEDPRVEIVHEDAAKFVQDTENHDSYDVVIADTLDPLGPAESMFEPAFFEAMYSTLREGGIVCTQGECWWSELDMVKDVLSCCSEIFAHVEYASTTVPTYPCGQIGFILAHKDQQRSFRTPVRVPSFQSDLKWYNPDLHRASFVLPQKVKTVVESCIEDYDNGYDNNEEDRCFLSECTIL